MSLGAATDYVPLAGIAPLIIAAGYYLWRVQHSVIGPMGDRLHDVEAAIEFANRVTAFERQERRVCEWRQDKMVQWLADRDRQRARDGEPLLSRIPDDLLYANRPPWATLPDPYTEREAR